LYRKITKLALIVLALGPLALSGCATGPSKTSSGSDLDTPDWSYVGSDSSGNSYFIDYGTIRRNGEYAKVAQKHVWKTPVIFCNGKNPGQSGRFVGEYDCRKGQTRSLFSTAYSGPDLDGELIFGNDASSPWRRVEPDTVAGDILEAICN
jgi:hypothetical protein